MQKISVEEAVHIWLTGGDSLPGPHLDTEDFQQLAETEAELPDSTERIDHLSRCPQCLQKWLHHLNQDVNSTTVSSSAALPADGFASGYGFLEAAADGELPTVMELHDADRRFKLSFFPVADRPDSRLVTLDALDSSIPEGCPVRIRDRNKKIVLSGHLVRGRLAGIVDNFSGYDLTMWEVSPQPTPNRSRE